MLVYKEHLSAQFEVDTYTEAFELMSLESDGGICNLLNDLCLGQRLDCHYFYLNDTTTNQTLVNEFMTQY